MNLTVVAVLCACGLLSALSEGKVLPQLQGEELGLPRGNGQLQGEELGLPRRNGLLQGEELGLPRSNGLLSALTDLTGGAAPAQDPDDAEQDDGATKAVKPAGERGIKKKLWYLQLWNLVYWYVWVFAAIAIKFKVALLIIWGHLTYFLVALIRVLIREVPLWVQLKREPVPVYGPPPQYGQYGSYGSNYKRRFGDTPAQPQQQAMTSATSGGQDLAYASHRK